MASQIATDYYPSNLKYALNQLSGFSRMRNKLILPFTSARAGDTIFFKLPSNCMVDLASLSFHFELTTGTATQMVCPQYTGCLIDQLSVDINGVNIQTVSMYNHLYKIMSNWTGGDMRNRNAFLEWIGMTDVAPNVTATMTSVPLAIKNWLGILGSNKILDLNILGEVTISMRLTPNLSFISATTNGVYTLNNMSVQFDTVNLDNPVYQQSIYRALENGGLKFGFQNILTNFGGSGAFPAVSQTFSVSTQSLDYLIGTLLQSDYATAGNAYHAASGSSYYFNHGSANINNAQFQIGTVLIPNFRPSLAEQLSYSLDSLNLTNDINGKSCETFKPIIGYANALPAGAVTAANQLVNYAAGNYCFAARLCHGDKGNGPLISGLSTAGTNTMINFRVDGTGNASFIPIVYAITTSTLTIGAGRQINLVI